MTVSIFKEFQEWPYRVARQEADFLADEIRVHVLKSSWAPDLAAQTIWSDISAHEADDVDYAHLVAAGKVINKDGNGRTVYDCADFDFGNAVSITGKYVVIRRYNVTAGLEYLMGYWDCNEGGGDLSSVNDDFDFTVNALGILRYTPAS